jgi:hypothetical protein
VTPKLEKGRVLQLVGDQIVEASAIRLHFGEEASQLGAAGVGKQHVLKGARRPLHPTQIRDGHAGRHGTVQDHVCGVVLRQNKDFNSYFT